MVRIVEQPLWDQRTAGINRVVEDIALIEDAEGRADNSLMVSWAVCEAELRAEICIRLMDFLPEPRLELIEERRVARAWSCQRWVHSRTERGGKILVGTIRINTPAKTGGERETWRKFPVVGNVSTLAPVLEAAAWQAEAGFLCKEALTIAKADTPSKVAIERIGGTRPGSGSAPAIGQYGSSCEARPRSKAEETREAATEDAVYAVSVANDMRAPYRASVIAELLI